MKLSDITTADIERHLHLDIDEADRQSTIQELTAMLAAAKAYITSYTGLTLLETDDYEDITIAALVLVGDMYDNRQMSVEKASVNLTVQTILDMHQRNLI